MSLFQPLLAVGVLAAAVVLGVVTHEFLHALCLRAAGVPHIFRLGGQSGAGRLDGGLGALASVAVLEIPPGTAPWQLRVASMAPLALAGPLVGIAAGVVPDPFASGNLYAQAALIGWLACALPSPQDFGQFWHAAEIVGDASDASSTRDPVAAD